MSQFQRNAATDALETIQAYFLNEEVCSFYVRGLFQLVKQVQDQPTLIRVQAIQAYVQAALNGELVPN